VVAADAIDAPDRKAILAPNDRKCRDLGTENKHECNLPTIFQLAADQLSGVAASPTLPASNYTNDRLSTIHVYIVAKCGRCFMVPLNPQCVCGGNSRIPLFTSICYETRIPAQ